MIASEQDGTVDVMMLEDGNTIVNEGNVMLSKAGSRKGTRTCKAFNREKFMEHRNM